MLLQLLGSAFVYAVSLVLTFRRSFVKNPKRRYIYAAVVGFIIGVLTWCTSSTRVSERDGVNALFEGSNPTGIPKFNIFSSEHNRFISLSVYHVIKFITCVLSITLPIPCGIFLPLMAVSGSFGRLFGEVVGLILENPSEPGLYAVVCAAGMIAGATHTISPCVIIIEITSQANNLMALLIVTVIGYAIAGMFTVSIYDMLIDVSGLPYLPRVQNSRMYDLRAKDVMHPDIHFLTLSSTVSDALNLLTHGRSPYEDSASLPQYPLVESASSMLFLGVVTRDDLETYVASSTRIGHVLKMVRHAEETSSAAPPAPLALTALVSNTLVPHLPALKSAPDAASGIRTGNSSERIDSGTLMMSPAVDAAAGGAGESKQSLTHSMEQQRVDDGELVPSAPDIGLSLTKSPSTASMSSLRAGNSFATPGRSASTHSMPAFASSRPGHHHDAQEDWLHRPLPFDLVPDADTDPEKAVSVDLAPFQVPELMSMPLLHFLFAVCMYSRIYVTHHGKLVGVVYKGDFLDEKWLAPESRI